MDVVSGPSQRGYALATSIVFGFGTILAVFNALALSVRPWQHVLAPTRNWTTGALFLDVAVLATLLILHRIQGLREVAAGYTTLSQAHIELPQIDPESGVIVREAGAAFLGRGAFKSAIRRARGEGRGP